MFGAGVLLGMAVVVRFHLGPAVTVAAIACCRLRLRDRWIPLALGGLLPLMALGVLDAATWSEPFHSILENFRVNIIESRSERYGLSPVYWYAQELVVYWGGAVFVMSLLVLWGARRAPVLLRTAMTIVLSHTFIAHKEYRFLYPAIACAILLADLGTAELVHSFTREGRDVRTVTLALACLGWLVTSLALAVQAGYRYQWYNEQPALEAALLARGYTAMCGIGLIGKHWAFTGGYTYLHKDVPIYLYGIQRGVFGHDLVASDWAAFNVALFPADSPGTTTAGFTRWRCFGPDSAEGVCLYWRAGVCASHKGLPEINYALQVANQ